MVSSHCWDCCTARGALPSQVVSGPSCHSQRSVLFCPRTFSLTGQSPQLAGPGQKTCELCRGGEKWKHLAASTPRGPNGSRLLLRLTQGDSPKEEGRCRLSSQNQQTKQQQQVPIRYGRGNFVDGNSDWASLVIKLREYPH